MHEEKMPFFIPVATSHLTTDWHSSAAGFKYWGEHQDDAVYLKFSVGLI